MKVCTVSEMRKADKAASENFGIPSIVLMENAAISCILEVIGFDSFTVLCGKGNNAGDGEFIGISSWISALIVGVASGLAATGSNQVFKQLYKAAQEGTLVASDDTPDTDNGENMN